MSEPKGPAIGAEEPSARKASKKASSSGGSSSKKSSGGDSDPNAAPPAYAAAVSSGPAMEPSQLSMAPASASPVPKLHDVPRIPIAEPKPVGSDSSANSAGEPKPRASKKRTVTPLGPDAPATGVNAGPSIASANGAPTLDAASAAKQEADAEREKQAAAARREAKRQRAKELEGAKRREELAKQAVEEAKREEEARLREARRKKELAALNANAEECQEEDEQADYEEDGFENYDDDFEDDDKPPEKNPNATPPQAKAKSKGTSGNSSNNVDEALSPAELKKIQQAMQAESKELSTSRPSSSSNAKADAISNNQEQKADRKKSGATSSIASSIAELKQSLDPRAKRAKEILDARKFELEKFNLFHQAPLSEQETYLSNLRRGQVRQVAIYTNDGAKSTLTQTKYPAGVDKFMHFPDDIGLDSASSSSNMTAKGAEGFDSGGADDDASMHSTVRFFKFLENAAYVCELLAEGNAMTVEQELEESKETKKRFPVTKNTVLSQHQVFPNKQFDDPAVEKLLQGRDLVAMRFSPCVSNILVTSYGPQESASKEDRDPNASTEKGVSCVWDVNQPHQALYVLKNEGLISTVNLGPNRELIALAGTEDGSIHVWDLRRQPYRSSSSCKSPAVKFCSPTYSTCGADYRTTSQHASTIVALEMIDRNRGSRGNNNDSHNNSSSGNFQFGSMDDRGIVIIWSLIEFEAGEDALVTDKCVEIGGRVKMVMNTLIDTQQQYMLPKQPKPMQRAASSSSVKPTNTSSTANAAREFTVGPIATVFKLFPHDPNQYVSSFSTNELLFVSSRQILTVFVLT